MAQAFGIITSPLAEEFHSIKAIRNTFAHAKMPLAFEHEVIDREIKAMSMGAAIRQAGGSSQFIAGTTNRNWFLLTVRLLLIVTDQLEASRHGADKAIAAAIEEGEQQS